MELQEIKKRKQALEDDFTKQIIQFETETGVCVTNVRLDNDVRQAYTDSTKGKGVTIFISL